MKYNGHKNWNHWNVSLWLNNDESLYRAMLDRARRNSRDIAAYGLLVDLKAAGITHTPDGAPYSVTSIKAAMVGL